MSDLPLSSQPMQSVPDRLSGPGGMLATPVPAQEMAREKTLQRRRAFRWLVIGLAAIAGLLGSSWAAGQLREHGAVSGDLADILRVLLSSLALFSGWLVVLAPFALTIPLGRWLRARLYLRRMLEDPVEGVILRPQAPAGLEAEAEERREELRCAEIARAVGEAYRNESWWFLSIWLRMGTGILALAAFCFSVAAVQSISDDGKEALLEDPLKLLILTLCGASLLVAATTPLVFLYSIAGWMKAVRRRQRVLYPRNHPDLREIS